MPERFEQYLALVAEAIRWRRARPFALKELRTHLLEQKEDFLASGMTETEAEEATIREMGDAAAVGRALDTVHRPKEQWGLLCTVLTLAVLGVVLRFALTWGWEFEAPHPLKTPLALLMGTAALLGGCFLDHRFLARHGGKVYAAALAAGVLSLYLMPKVNGASWYTRNLCCLYPLVYALWVSRWRGKGWPGMAAAILGGIPLCLVECSAPSVSGLLILLAAGFAVMLSAAGRDWFGVGRNKGLAAAFGAAAALAIPAANLMYRSASFHRRLSLMLHPELELLASGYQGTSVRSVLSGVQWLGQGSLDPTYGGLPYEHIVPEWEGDFLMTTLAHKWGWLPFLLLCGAVLVLCAAVLLKAVRCPNPAGGLAALAVGLTLVLQTAGSILNNLGFVLHAVSMPFLGGNLHTVVTMALLGAALSVFRQEALPEEDPGALEVPAPAVQTA